MVALTSLVYSLYVLNNTIARDLNAVCLDGSPYAFYYHLTDDASAKDKWQIHFEGGGWCYDDYDCSNRAKTALGSSTSYEPTMKAAGGILSPDCTKNPTFCNYNTVYLKYCDGNSFSGFLDKPYPVKVGPVSTLHFRGRAILDAVLRTLVTSPDFGMNTATDVHLSGCSAGGLSAYLHTNFVGDFLAANVPTLQRYKVTPVSGFFLLHNNVLDVPVYGPQMKSIFEMSNATFGVDQDCIAATNPDDQWTCNFAPFVYEHTRYPVFVLNSAYDSWMAGCVLGSSPIAAGSGASGNCSSVEGWKDCLGKPSSCNSAQIFSVIEFESNFVTEMVRRDAYARAGNGAFVHSCLRHCEAMGDDFVNIKIGGVSMSAAVATWWDANNEPALNHTYLPCTHQLDGTNCNPTCGGDMDNSVLVPRAIRRV